MNPILIGGAPCAGKSTVAQALAKELKVTLGELDDLRDDFKDAKVHRRHHYPWIFSSVDISAEEFWKTRTPADVMKVEIEQAREFWPEVKKFIASGMYGVLEGVSLLPELIWDDFGDTIKAVFLIDPNRKRIRQTALARGIWDDANTYADWVKELEVDWVMLHNNWFREQAKKYPYPLVEVGEAREGTAEMVRTAVK